MYKPALFFISDVIPLVEGIHDPSVRWNGWCCPLFDRWAAQVICESIQGVEDTDYDGAHYVWDSVNGRVIEQVWNTGILESENVLSPTLIDNVEYYPIGVFEWTWWSIGYDEYPFHSFEALNALQQSFSQIGGLPQCAVITEEDGSPVLTIVGTDIDGISYQHRTLSQAIHDAYALREWSYGRIAFYE